MAKLTRKQISELSQALHHARRAQQYIAGKDVVVARRGTRSTTTLDYVRASDGAVLYEVAKDIGSGLCGLWDCVRALEQFLQNQTQDINRAKRRLA